MHNGSAWKFNFINTVKNSFLISYRLVFFCYGLETNLTQEEVWVARENVSTIHFYVAHCHLVVKRELAHEGQTFIWVELKESSG